MAEGFRVSPPKVFPVAAAAPKPAIGTPGADAHRQAGFVLGAEVEAVLSGLNAEGAIAEATAGAKYRKQLTASALGPWSRGWLTRLQALHAVQWGNYAAALPLVRAATDYQAAEVELLQAGAAEWEEWLQTGGVRLAPEDHALEYQLHAFRSGEVLAGDPILGPIYRAVSDLSLPHFGATLLVAGAESDPARVAMTFGDRDFHLGLAELVLGWLLELSAAQLATCDAYPAAFGPAPSAARSFTDEAERLVARPDRCRVEAVERGGERRYLLSNWRRTPGAAAKKLLL